MSASRLRDFIAFTLFFSLTACGSDNEVETVFPQDSQACESTAIPNQFIVHWKSGEREVVSGLSREELITALIDPRKDEIARVDYDRRIEVPSFPQIQPQAQGSNWGLNETHATEAWDQGVRGDGAVVAIVDSGVDYTHSYLAQQVFYNSGEEGTDDQGKDKRYNQKDDDENGYVDDWAGYNFAYKDGNPNDSGSHGTHVAGIVAAQHDLNFVSSSQPQGVAPEAKILPIAFIGSGGAGSLSAALEALDYAALRGAHIINASWGGVSCAPSLGKKILSLGQKGILFVAAAGNRGVNIEERPEFPASFNYPLQVTVGSVGRLLGMADHSNFGRTSVHIFAPGVDILSTVPGNAAATMTGTSMATPFVSGALALLKSHRPQASPQHLRQALMEGVDIQPSYINSSSGRLHIGKALSALEALAP